MTDLTGVTELLAQIGRDAGGDVKLLLSALPPERARMLRRCAIPHSFDEDIVKELDPDIDRDTVRACIEELAHLSVIGQGDSEFYVHDRARDFLFREWLADPGPEFAAISKRLHRYFKKAQAGTTEDEGEILKRNSVFHLLGADREAGLALLQSLFEFRYDHLRYSDCDALLKLAREYEPVLTRECQLALMLMDGLVLAGMREFDRAEQNFRAVAEEATGTDQIRAVLAMARLLRERKQFGRAASYLQRGLRLVENRPDAALSKARLMLEEGLLARDRYQPDRAEGGLRKAAVAAKRAGGIEEFADAENALGNLLRRRGDAKGAIRHFQMSLKGLDPATHQLKRARIYSNLGIAYSDISEWEQSELFLKKSLRGAVESQDMGSQARVLNNIAKLFLRQGNIADATIAYRGADFMFVKLGDYRSAAVAMSNLCRMLTDSNPEEATAAMKVATEHYRRANSPARAIALEREFYRSQAEGRDDSWWWMLGQLSLVLILLAAFIFLFDASR